MNTNKTTAGIYLAIGAAVISGVSIFVNKYAVNAIKPPLFFTSVKNIGVGLLIFGILIAARKLHKFRTLNRREVFYLILIGVIGGSLPFYLFFTGLAQIPALTSALIQKTLVFWVVLLAIPFLKERLSKIQVVGVLCLFAANFVIGGFQGFKFSQGELFVLLATILWGIESVIAKKTLATVDPDLVTASRMGLGSLILITATAIIVPQAVFKGLTMTGTQLFWLGLTMVTLLGYVSTWYRALKYAPAITVTSVLVASTLVTNVLSAIFTTHVWTWTLGVQGLLIFTGIVLTWVGARSEIRKISSLTSIAEDRAEDL